MINKIHSLFVSIVAPLLVCLLASVSSSEQRPELPQEITSHYLRMLGYHRSIDDDVPAGSTLFIGDSHIQGLCVNAVITPSINYGIGGDTTIGILGRLQFYESIAQGQSVVLSVGVNDLFYRSIDEIVKNYEQILKKLPSNIPVIVSAIHPINENSYNNKKITNSMILSLNEKLKRLCDTNQSNWYFLNIYDQLVDKKGI